MELHRTSHPRLIFLTISTCIVLYTSSAWAEVMFIPGVRLGLGAGVHPGRQEVGKVDVDLALSGALVNEGDIFAGGVAELGYSHHVGDEVGGHYGTIMLGASVIHAETVGGTVFTTLMLGERQNTFDVGVRAGLRLELLWGIFSPECAYEFRTGDAGDINSVHVTLAIDFLRVFVLFAYTGTAL